MTALTTPTTLGSHLTLGALRSPDRLAVAMLDGPGQTYAELDRATNRVARALRGAGVGRGDRVAIWMDNALEYLPDNIGVCTTLVKLYLSTNRLTALPSSLALLPRLQRLDASANMLATVPAALGASRTLKEFNLR